jgi:hypothetical protein
MKQPFQQALNSMQVASETHLEMKQPFQQALNSMQVAFDSKLKHAGAPFGDATREIVRSRPSIRAISLVASILGAVTK